MIVDRRMAVMVATVLWAVMAVAVAQGYPPQGGPPPTNPSQNATIPLSTMAPPPRPAENGGPENHTDWKNEKFERQELREEMEQIRKEHEDLESARDRLKEKCGGGSEPPPDCEQQKQALRDRHEQLHERTLALREKIQADRRDHPEEYSMQHSSWPPSDHGPEQLHGQPPVPPQATEQGPPAMEQVQPPAPPPPSR